MKYIIILCLDVLLICLITCYLEVILKGVKYSPLYDFTQGSLSDLYSGRYFNSIIELLCFPHFGLVMNSREKMPCISLSDPLGIDPDVGTSLGYFKLNKIYTVRLRSFPISKAFRFNKIYN